MLTAYSQFVFQLEKYQKLSNLMMTLLKTSMDSENQVPLIKLLSIARWVYGLCMLQIF